MQADAEVIHGGKGHRQHQGNRQGYHQAGAHAEREETHQQHDRQCLDQHLDKFTDPGFHRRWLIRNLAQLHTGREIIGNTGELGFQRLAQHQNVATGFHRHGEANGILAHEAHAWRGWVVEPTTHLSHITDTERTVTHPDGELFYLLDGVKAPTYPQLQALTGGLEETGGADRVLLLKRLLYGCQR
ncbi:hypothetical protein D3C77_399210 [compost metagenome]